MIDRHSHTHAIAPKAYMAYMAYMAPQPTGVIP